MSAVEKALDILEIVQRKGEISLKDLINMTGRCILRLYEPSSGDIIFDGKNISNLPESKIRPLRSNMGVISQDPFSSLNPRRTAGSVENPPLRNIGAGHEVACFRV